MTITIVGLGPGDPALATRAAWDILTQAEEVYLRTREHPTVAGLQRARSAYDEDTRQVIHSFDHIYAAADDFTHIYTAIAEEVIRLGRRPQGVVYAVPGHPCIGEATTREIRKCAAAQQLEVRFVDGLSFIEPLCTLLELDPLDGLQIHDAMLVACAHHPPLEPALPALLGQLYSRSLASDVKLTLLNAYPDKHPVTVVQGAATASPHVQTVPLYELDRLSSFDYLTTLYVPPIEPGGSFAELQEVIAHLRSPEGCPWDREQTHFSLRRNLLEEAYEVLEALDALESSQANDREAVQKLAEELGDFLLQVVLQTQIAADEGEFRMADVIRSLVTKLIRRHPHVFSDVEVADAAEVTRNWDRIKQGERGGAAASVFDGVPKGLPALLQAQALHGKATRAGASLPGPAEKARRTSDGFPVACRPGRNAAFDANNWLEEHVPDEKALGQLLWEISTWAAERGWDAEAALRTHNQRFVAAVTDELDVKRET